MSSLFSIGLALDTGRVRIERQSLVTQLLSSKAKNDHRFIDRINQAFRKLLEEHIEAHRQLEAMRSKRLQGETVQLKTLEAKRRSESIS